MSWLSTWPFETHVPYRLTLSLAHFLWQGTAIAGLAAIVAACRPGASARWRYAVHVAALIAMAACPPVTYAIVSRAGGGSVPTPGSIEGTEHPSTVATPAVASADDRAESGTAASRDNSLIDRPEVEFTPPADSAPGAGAGGPRAWLIRSALYASATYLAGVLLMLGRLIVALAGGWRLRRAAVPVADPRLLATVARQARRLGLRLAPPLAWCGRVTAPVVVGLLRPAILLPMSLAGGMTPEQLESLLTHELGHIRRFDLWVNLLQRLVEAGLFFHPAVWFVSRRISAAREDACDDLVLATGWPRAQYADALVRMAELCLEDRGDRFPGRAALPSAALLSATGDRPSQLKRRVLRVLGAQDGPAIAPSPRGLAVALLSAALLAAVPLLNSWAEPGAETAAGPETAAIAETPEADAGGDGIVEASAKQGDATLEVAGQVVNAIGAPIGQARVAIVGDPQRETQTDAEGRFRLTGLPPGWLELTVHSDDADRRTLFVRAGTTNARIHLRQSSLYNQARNRWSVTIETPEGKTPGSTRYYLLDLTDGRPTQMGEFNQLQRLNLDLYKELGLYAGHRFGIVVTADGFAVPPVAELVLDPDPQPVTIKLRRAPMARMRGRIVDENGQPMPGVRIGMFRTLAGVTIDDRRLDAHVTESGVVVSDEQGRFELYRLKQGEVITVYANTLGHAGVRSAPVTIAEEPNISLPDMKLAVANRTIRGQVVNHQGQPIAGATVAVRDFTRPLTTTDEQGRFEMTAPDGELPVNARAPGFARIYKRLPPDSEEVNFELPAVPSQFGAEVLTGAPMSVPADGAHRANAPPTDNAPPSDADKETPLGHLRLAP